MTNFQLSSSEQSALQVAQQAVAILAHWAGVHHLPNGFQYPEDSDAIKQAKKILSWPIHAKPEPLNLLFENVNLAQGEANEVPRSLEFYWPATYIEGSNPLIPYTRKESPPPEEIESLKRRIKQSLTLEALKAEDWNNLPFLTLILEKFGSYLSFGDSDVALVDVARTTGALAAALANNSKATEISLVAGDLSGIQKFIYTISSAGALKSLRARSFYLELVTEEVVQQLLAKLELPRTNVIYAGGGNLYLLAAATETIKQDIEEVRNQVNEWLLKEFQSKVFLALDYLTFPTEEVGTQKFAEYWGNINQPLADQKSRKFKSQIAKVLERHSSYEPCRVCHRDDVEKLQPLNEPDSVLACPTCRQMFSLGEQLLRVEAIVRSHRESIDGAEKTKLSFQITSPPVYYHLFKSWNSEQIGKIEASETVFLVNDWMVDNYRSGNVVPLLLGNYAQDSQEEPSSFISAGEMAEKATQAGAIPRVGYLRMDVDRLGQIFARGLGDRQTLPRLAGLSRQMSYFFKVYLNSLAKNRLNNLPKNSEDVRILNKANSRQNLLFIYAGGDDLFVSGAWNEIVDFTFDVYQCFRAYTGYNSDITLSGGVSIAGAKFPLYQAAEESGDAEEQAKGNGRDSLGLFGETFKWSEWLGTSNLPSLSSDDRDYLQEETTPDLLLGVLPFVVRLNEQLELDASRSFVRNLLATAQLQDRMIADRQRQIDEIKRNQPRKSQDDPTVKKLKRQNQEIRYYLHLPKIAYTIARLPKKVREHPDFAKVRTSLRSPYNARYFKAIATWIELLNRASSSDNIGKEKKAIADNVRIEKEAIAEKFRALVLEWDRDVAGISFVAQKISHPAYQQIIEMGTAVVPLLLKELQERPNHWFTALSAITGADPIQPEQYGKTKQMAAAWLEWAREQGYTW